jgi:hypothetical protein
MRRLRLLWLVLRLPSRWLLPVEFAAICARSNAASCDVVPDEGVKLTIYHFPDGSPFLSSSLQQPILGGIGVVDGEAVPEWLAGGIGGLRDATGEP